MKKIYVKYHKHKKYHQIGTSVKALDTIFKAKRPGKRKSKKGKVYYETRRNRTDMPGSRL
jgi:hypothetical protein